MGKVLCAGVSIVREPLSHPVLWTMEVSHYIQLRLRPGDDWGNEAPPPLQRGIRGEYILFEMLLLGGIYLFLHLFIQ